MTIKYSEAEIIRLITENQGIIYKVCNMYCKWKEDREDLFQEILLRIWQARTTFRQEAKITTWMYRIALNTAIDASRRKKTAFFPLEAVRMEVPEVPDVGEDQYKALHEAIAQLSAVEKAIVTLYLEAYTYAQIGEVMGISANYVAVKMNRIKRMLKHNIRQ